MVLDACHHCFPSALDDYRVGLHSASQYRSSSAAPQKMIALREVTSTRLSPLTWMNAEAVHAATSRRMDRLLRKSWVVVSAAMLVVLASASPDCKGKAVAPARRLIQSIDGCYTWTGTGILEPYEFFDSRDEDTVELRQALEVELIKGLCVMTFQKKEALARSIGLPGCNFLIVLKSTARS